MAVILDGDGIKSDVEIKKSTTTGLSVVENITRFPNRPTFSAYGNTIGSRTVGSTIVYPSISVNVGNGYDNTTGVFTAPVAGVYEFSWGSIGNTTADVYRLGFRVNGAKFNNLDFHLRLDTVFTGSEYASNVGYTLIVPLQANDNVSILFFEGSSLYYNPTAWYNYFNGWLVK